MPQADERFKRQRLQGAPLSADAGRDGTGNAIGHGAGGNADFRGEHGHAGRTQSLKGYLSVVMSACVGRGGRLGLAYVDLDEPERVLRVADVAASPDFIELWRLKHSLLCGAAARRAHAMALGQDEERDPRDPHGQQQQHQQQQQHHRREGLCVVPSRAPAELLQCVAEPLASVDRVAAGLSGDDLQLDGAFPVAVLKAADFDAEPCRQRLLHLWASLGGAQLGGHRPTAAAAQDFPDMPPEAHSGVAAPASRPPLPLDLGNEQLVRAAGGLLRFLERNRAELGDLEGPWQGPCVQDLRLFSPEDSLFVDAQTMCALQVFAEEQHPSLVRGCGRAKEGLSLYGLLEPLTASAAGRATLRRWLQQPSRDLKLLRERQDAVEKLVSLARGSGAELIRELHRELREVRDLPSLLRRVYGCYHFDNAADWRALIATLGHMSSALALLCQAAQVGKRGSGRDSSGSSLGPLIQGAAPLAEDICVAEDLLRRIVDLDGASNAGNGSPESSPDARLVHVRAGVDRRLDDKRGQYADINRHLTEVAELECQRLASLLPRAPGGRSRLTELVRAIAFHYFPQLGFHGSLPNPLAAQGVGDGDAAAMEALKREGGIPQPAEDWSYQFAGGGRLFYKCDLARRLDSEVGDLVVQSRELELEILLQLLERFRLLEPRLRRAARLLADLDVLVAFGTAAMQMNWVRPQLHASKPGLLRIVKGRHPLVEAAVVSHHGFVPNNTDLGAALVPAGEARAQVHDSHNNNDNNNNNNNESADTGETASRIQVVTGANLAGKSVYLKQVGLITLLAQVGSFVPADAAELGLCDFIFSRIQNHDGAAARCSSFVADLSQLSLALRHATPASLVLLDEFGKGTRSADGVALLGATVEYLCRWQQGPKAVITTHFTEIFRCGLVSTKEPGLLVSSLRVLPPEKQDIGNGHPEGDESGGAVVGDGSAGVAYLYQLVGGVAEKSFGLECARRAGLEVATVQRAAEILAALERGEAVVPPPPTALRRCAEAAATANHREARCLAACRLAIDRLCSLNPNDEATCRALLGFVWAQQGLLRDAGAGA